MPTIDVVLIGCNEDATSIDIYCQYFSSAIHGLCNLSKWQREYKKTHLLIVHFKNYLKFIL